MTLVDILKRGEKFTTDNSPTILTAVGVVGVLTTAYLTGKASFEAAQKIDDAQRWEDLQEKGHLLDNKEKLQLVWKVYILPAGSAAFTITAVICGNRIGSRRTAAMAAAYAISERAFDEYREKVVERIGQKKEQTVRDEIAQDRVRRDPVGNHEVIITGGGDVLCYDMYTGRYFHSDMETLKKAQNDTNYQILNDMHASLNDFYGRIGLSSIKTGEEVGWNCDKQLELKFSTTLSDDQRPCIAIDFSVMPVRGYYKLH